MLVNVKAVLASIDHSLAGGKHRQAHELASRALSKLRATPAESRNPELIQLVQRFKEKVNESHPAWWDPFGDENVRFRRTVEQDAEFYKLAYSNKQWAMQFNRQTPWSGNLQNALAKAGLSAPLKSGSVLWLIENCRGEPLGFASLTSIDRVNSKAEVSLGMVGEQSPVLIMKAFLHVLKFAFEIIKLNKLYALVYQDNLRIKAMLSGLGFTNEGTLRAHYFLPPGEYIDLILLGMLRAEYTENKTLERLANRWIRGPASLDHSTK